MTEYITGTTHRFTKWWLKTREIEVWETEFGRTACAEFYCPIYFKPLDFLYNLIFGKPTLSET